MLTLTSRRRYTSLDLGSVLTAFLFVLWSRSIPCKTDHKYDFCEESDSCIKSLYALLLTMGRDTSTTQTHHAALSVLLPCIQHMRSCALPLRIAQGVKRGTLYGIVYSTICINNDTHVVRWRPYQLVSQLLRYW